MKSSEILGRLLDTVTEETWYQGALFNFAGTRACLVGHVARVVEHTDTVGKVRGYETACEALNHAIYARYPDRVAANDSKSPIARFNDHTDTTIEDVHLVIKDAYVESLDETAERTARTITFT
jgi:hypothetical protein